MMNFTKPIQASLLMSLSAACIMFGYEMIRSSSTTLLKATYGIQSFPFIMSFIPLVILPLIYIYGKAIERHGPKVTLLAFMGLSGSFILLLYTLILKKISFSIIALFLFREAYIVLIVEQYWSYIDSILTEKEGKKFNGYFLGISSTGAIIGGAYVHKMSQVFGTIHLLIPCVIACFLGLIAAYFAYQTHAPKEQKVKDKKKESIFSIKTFQKSPTLWSILGIIVASQAFSTVTEYNFQTALTKNFSDQDSHTAFMGFFYGSLNLASMVFHFLLSPLLLKTFSLYWIHICIPICHLIVLSISLLSPSLSTLALSFGVFKALDYSIFRAAKEVLYIPLPYDARFKAKEIIDVFGYRLSKSVTSGFVFLGQALISTVVLSSFGVVFLLLWMKCLYPYVQRKSVFTLDKKISSEV